MTDKNNQKKLFPFTVTSTYEAIGIIEGFEDIPHDVDEYNAHVQAWQHLVDTGTVWTLQAWYGRTAESLIEQGIITCDYS